MVFRSATLDAGPKGWKAVGKIFSLFKERKMGGRLAIRFGKLQFMRREAQRSAYFKARTGDYG